jgi:hypothetical protein
MTSKELTTEEILPLVKKTFAQSSKTVLVVVWILVIVVIVAYIFQIMNAVYTINMLQTAQPNDSFKEDENTYQLYKNSAIGTITMSTMVLVVTFLLLGSYYTFRNSSFRLFQLVTLQQPGSSAVTTSNQPLFDATNNI